MADRDPRVDPHRGDVVRLITMGGTAYERTVLRVWRGRVWWEVDGVQPSLMGLCSWRRDCATAAVVRAEEG